PKEYNGNGLETDQIPKESNGNGLETDQIPKESNGKGLGIDWIPKESNGNQNSIWFDGALFDVILSSSEYLKILCVQKDFILHLECFVIYE
ncbi:hypothetical protein AB6A40_009327, partial [Gnathostoma spinigerum]